MLQVEAKWKQSESKVKDMAKAFHSLSYEVSVLADTDADDQFSQVDIIELEALSIPVYVWSDKCAIEQRAILDLPWPSVLASVRLAKDNFGQESVNDKIGTKFNETLNKNISKWHDSQELRKAIGDSANEKKWFKSITKGSSWFSAIAPAFDNAEFLKKDLAVKLNELWEWAERE